MAKTKQQDITKNDEKAYIVVYREGQFENPEVKNIFILQAPILIPQNILRMFLFKMKIFLEEKKILLLRKELVTMILFATLIWKIILSIFKRVKWNMS